MQLHKLLKVGLAFMLVLLSVLPSGNIALAGTQAPTPAAWPAVFSPYTLSEGTAIYDPADDEHPTSTDITSGIDKGVGLLPSMYVASDSNNFFVRLRVKGDPYDRKGGFLSTVWMVKLLDSVGNHKATIGLNGKPTDKDYVYVANADGSVVEKVYEDTVASNTVPGTRIVPAENGQYFIDFQVPVATVISTINDASITNATNFKLEFGTSRAANLSVINKETMDTAPSGGAAIKLTQTPLSISIDGGSSKEYSATNNVVTGKSSIVSGTASISINGGTATNVTINNNIWSYTLPSDITSTNGVHKAAITLTNNGKTVIAKQDVMISNATENLFIDGGLVAYTGSTSYLLKGSFNTTKASNNYDIVVTVTDKNGTSIVNNQTVGTKDNTTKLWSYGNVTLGTPADGDKFSITAISKEKGANGATLATAKQTLIYKQGLANASITVNLGTIASGEAKPVITGGSSGASQVEVRIDGVSTAFATPDGTGAWSIPELEKPLSTGDHTITAVATNTSGNTAVASVLHNVTATAITIDNGSSLVTNDRTPTIRGNTNGTNVTLTFGGQTYTTAASNGRWSVETTKEMADGLSTATATVTGASATQNLTIDGSTNVSITAPSGSMSDKKPEFKGTTEANNDVTLKVIDSLSSVVFIQNLTADSSGNWTYIPTTDLAKDDYSISVVAADAYGNEATATGSFTIADAPVVTVSTVDSVTKTVDYGTDETTAKGQLPATVTGKLSNGENFTADVEWSPTATPAYDGNTAADYVYEGTLSKLPSGVENSASKTATATVTVSPKQLSSDKEILTFSVDGHDATIDSGAKTVTLELPAGSMLEDLIPVFTLSNGAKAYIGETEQTSGEASNSYVTTVTYIVHAEDGSTKEWIVTITVLQEDQTAAPIVNDVYVGDTSISGTAEANATVIIDGIGTTTAYPDGKWTITKGSEDVWNLQKDQQLSVTAQAENKTVSNVTTTTVLVNIQLFENFTYKVFKGTPVATLKSLLATEAKSTLVDESAATVTISWDTALEGLTTINTATELTAKITGELPTNVKNNNDVYPTASIELYTDLTIAGSQDGSQKITVTGAQPGASVQLYDSKGESVGNPQIAGEDGTVTFAEVAYGTGYTVVQTVTVGEVKISSAKSDEVAVTKVDIESFQDFTYKVFKGIPVDTLKSLLAAEAEATLSDETTTMLDISWATALKDVTAINEGTTLTAEITEELPSNVSNTKEVYPKATIELYTNLTIEGSQDGSQKITITGAQPGASVQLYDSEGNKVGEPQIADNDGNVTFEEVAYGTGYTVVQTVTVGDVNISSAKSEEVDVTKVDIESFQDFTYKVFKGTSVDTLKNLLAKEAEATLSDKTKATLDISWETAIKDVIAINEKTALTAEFSGELPNNVFNTNNVYPKATIELYDDLTIAGSQDGSQKITVTGAQPGASVQLYDSKGDPVGEPQVAGESGTVTFAEVAYGTGYAVVQTVNEGEIEISSAKSKEVDVVALENKLKITGSIDGLKTVTITNATSGATITLYDKNGEIVATATADEHGKVIFTNVKEGLDYYATETIDGNEAKPSSKVDVLPKIKIRYLEKDIWESVTLDVFAMKQLLSEKYPITWTSSDENVLKVTAQVDGEYGDYQIETTRPEKEDKSVVLTAKFIFEGKEIERTFLLVVKGKNFSSKTSDNSDNDVKLNNGDTPLTNITTIVKRTTLTGDGGQQEFVDKLIINEDSGLSGDDVSITFDNKSGGQEANEQAVEIASGALRGITGDLTVETPEGTFNLPQAGIGTLTAQGNDLFFRIVPMRTETEKQAVIDRTKTAMNKEAGAGKQAQVVDIPREIETNYSSIDTWITLPIKTISLTKKQATDTLRLYIEHTDGTKETIKPGVGGAVLVDANGVPVNNDNDLVSGLKFKINRFSTFTFFTIADVPSPSGGGGMVSLPSSKVTVTTVEGTLLENEIVKVLGEATALTNVDLFVNDQLMETVPSDASGNWSYAFKEGLAAGTYEIRAEVKDTAGMKISSNVMTLTIQGKQGKHIRYIYGFEEGTFGPQKLVTRAQVAAMLSRNLTANQVPDAQRETYKDTSNNWAKDEIEYARIAGIMQGYQSGYFGPNDHVTRAQLAVIAARWIDKQCQKNLTYSKYCEEVNPNVTLKDIKGHWAENEIKTIAATGIMVGSQNGLFRPNDKLTRQEAVKVLNRLFLRGPLEGVSTSTFPDVPVNHWAFKEVEEAATDHLYELKNNQEYLRK